MYDCHLEIINTHLIDNSLCLNTFHLFPKPSKAFIIFDFAIILFMSVQLVVDAFKFARISKTSQNEGEGV